MQSTVYSAGIKTRRPGGEQADKIRRLFGAAGLGNMIMERRSYRGEESFW